MKHIYLTWDGIMLRKDKYSRDRIWIRSLSTQYHIQNSKDRNDKSILLGVSLRSIL